MILFLLRKTLVLCKGMKVKTIKVAIKRMTVRNEKKMIGLDC